VVVRYVYLGDRQTDPELKGRPCDPVRRPDGHCIVSRSRQLVRFADGRRIVVNRRMLRLVKPVDWQRWEYVDEFPGGYIWLGFEGDVNALDRRDRAFIDRIIGLIVEHGGSRVA
jgi:hypothetical protein